MFLDRWTIRSGYIIINADGQSLGKSVVTMLPVINLSVTNMIALHSLLFLEVEHRKNNKLPTPSIAFDQTLHVRACETIMRNKTKSFARLGCFHQLRRFLGSIGSLMEKSGVKRALETA